MECHMNSAKTCDYQEEHNHQVAVVAYQMEEKDHEINRLTVQVTMAQDDIEEFQILEEALKARGAELESENEKQKVCKILVRYVGHLTQFTGEFLWRLLHKFS